MLAVWLAITALLALALLTYMGGAAACAAIAQRSRASRRERPAVRVDPGVERRAERKARVLLRSIVNPEDWEMYRDLGFIRVVGRMTEAGAGSYSYLIYPHRPIVAYLPGSDSLLSEYCVEFRDHGERGYGPKLPDSDDVLAKWMMIKADEERLMRGANMHLPGRQVDPQQVRRDLARLREWERSRSQSGARAPAASAAASLTTGNA